MSIVRNAARALIERSPRLASYARYFRDTRGLFTAPRRSADGFLHVGDHACMTAGFEPEEKAIFAAFMDRFDRLVNVGANVGLYTCLALQHGKPAVAIEPKKENVQFLLRNIDLNGWAAACEVFPVAVADKPGALAIYGSGTGASLVPGWAGTSAGHVELVPISTLDILVGDRFAGERLFVLVDVEGAELAAVSGGASLLRRDPKPIWMVEICIGEHQPAGVAVNPQLLETFGLFWDAGYRAWTAAAAARQVERAEIEAIAAGGPDRLGTHNFLFLDAAEPAARQQELIGAAFSAGGRR